MHILYFHQHFTTPDGTGGTRSYELARALIARGHQVTMVCGRSERSKLPLPLDSRTGFYQGEIDGIKVIALPLDYSNRDGLLKRAWLFWRFAWGGVRLALKLEYDLLFATSTPLTAALPGVVMRLARKGKPFIFEVRDLWPELPRALGMKNPVLLGAMSLLEWLGYRYAQACVGLSPGIVEGIRKRAPEGRRIDLVPNGCDLDLFHSRKASRLDLPGINPNDFVAGFTGAHGIANGLDAVLDCAKALRRRGRGDIKLVLIGDGNQKDRLEKRAAAEGLANVLFFPPVKKTEIARITASFDCGLMILANIEAFYFGTSPNKFFDYISSGIPVLNNYPGWLAGLIKDNHCGIAVSPDDPEAFADALIQLADNREASRKMGLNARRLAEAQFSRDRLAARFVDVVEAVFQQNTPVPALRKDK
jgi:glycosyltransferase involved in cell wall biosynthesis